MKGGEQALLSAAVVVLLAGSLFDLYEFSMEGTTSSPVGVSNSSSINNLVGAISTFTTTQSVQTTIIASTVFAPSTTSSGNTSTACTVIYPGGENALFLRVVSDSNQTPVVGARVTATHEVTGPTCVGSAPTTTQITLAFTTGGAEWYSFDTLFSGSYSIVVAYSGHSYSLSSASTNAEAQTATCESLYIPSGRTTLNVTAPMVLDCSSIG